MSSLREKIKDMVSADDAVEDVSIICTRTLTEPKSNQSATLQISSNMRFTLLSISFYWGLI